MRKNIIVVLLIFAIPLITYFMLTMSNATTAKTANSVNKPQVLKFTSQMCLDCQTMNKIFKDIFPKYKDSIVLTEIQVQDRNSFNNSMIERHNVTLVPTIILIDSQGTVVKRIEGAVPMEEMDKLLKELCNG